MKAGTMQGLIGANINMKLVDTPIRVYKEAERKGDLGTMERAMGYASDLKNTAYEYKDQAEEELRKEMKENREEQQKEREEAIEERREAQKESQKEAVEKLAEKTEEMRKDGQGSTESIRQTQADSLTISEEGQKLLQENRPAPKPDLPDMEAPEIPAATDTKPETKFYSSAGTAIEPQTAGVKVSVNI